MLITAVQIKKVENSGTKLKGIAEITLDDMIVIHDIKVLQSSQKMFLAMPSREFKAGTFRDIVHPINRAVRDVFEKLIFAAYEEAVQRQCISLEMRVDSEAATNLTEQKAEDFKVVNVSEPLYFTEKKEESAVDVPVKNTLDESLMRWLES